MNQSTIRKAVSLVNGEEIVLDPALGISNVVQNVHSEFEGSLVDLRPISPLECKYFPISPEIGT